MEKFLLSERTVKFEMWQAVLVALFLFLGLMTFGALVDDGARASRGGVVSKAANKFARIPALSIDVVGELADPTARQKAWLHRFEGDSGFTFYEGHTPKGDLMLLARHDGSRNRAVLEIVDMDTGEVLPRISRGCFRPQTTCAHTAQGWRRAP